MTSENNHIQTKHKSILFVFGVCANAVLSSFYVGYVLVYISTFVDFNTIINIYNIKIGTIDLTQSLITGCVPIGSMIGALFTSVLLKRFSRRNCFLFANLMVFVGMIICFIKTGFTLIIGRLILGICKGIFVAIVPLYINEFVPLKLKHFGTLHQTFITSAQSFTFLFYFILTEPMKIQDKDAYNWVSNFLIVTILIQTFVFFFIYPYETPKYWYVNRQYQKCKQLLQRIYKEEWVQQAYDQIALTNQQNQNNQKKQLEKSLIQNQSKSSISLSISGSTDAQLKKQNHMPKIAIALAIHVALFQQLTGVNSVALYGGKIVNQVFPHLNKIIPIFTLLLPAIATVFANPLMRKYGRKTLLQTGGIVLLIALLMMCIGFAIEPETDNVTPKILIVASQFIFMGSFGLTLGPIIWLFVPQFVEPNIIPYSTMINQVGATICVIVFPIASAQLPNKAYLFGIYLVYGIFALIINQKYLVQTKDKKRIQIYKQLEELQKNLIKK